MADFEIRKIVSQNIEKELSLLGFDEHYKNTASKKF